MKCSDIYTVNYGLEEHLREMASENIHCTAKYLYGLWIVNKKNLVYMLAPVSPMYLSYSDHGSMHSQAIINAINQLLGPDRVKLLSPTDTWLLLECAYRHDMGMHVKNEEIKNFIRSDDFDNFIKKMKTHTDCDLREAADCVMPLNNKPDIKSNEKLASFIFENELKLRMILSEYYRRRHGQRSEENNLDNPNEIVPKRIWGIMAHICKGHTSEREKIYKELEHFEKGVGDDVAHPRLIQMLIRLGDLLDLDNNRFNSRQLELLGNELPKSSETHILKHLAVTHISISPDGIEAIASFENSNEQFKKSSVLLSSLEEAEYLDKARKRAEEYKEKTGVEILDYLKDNPLISSEKLAKRNEEKNKYYSLMDLQYNACWVTTEWFDLLEKELKHFALNWGEIVPVCFTGFIPIKRRFEVWWQGKKMDSETINLKYTISHERAANIIQGTGLYGDIEQKKHRPLFINKEFTFIRELIQNAMDATKIQVFRSLKNGKYGGHVLLKLGNNTAEWNAIDVMSLIGSHVDSLAVELDIKYVEDFDNNERKWRFIVLDNGIGIDSGALKSMSQIGNTKSELLKEEIECMPEWLKPNGSFGIGMQSVFGICDRFKAVSGSRKDHIVRDLFFKTAKDGGNLYAVERAEFEHGKKYGTKIVVELTDEKMREIIDVDVLRENIEADVAGYHINIDCDTIIKSLRMQIKENLEHDIIPVKINFYVNDVEIKHKDYKIEYESIFRNLIIRGVKN